jgi:hypothetical protein
VRTIRAVPAALVKGFSEWQTLLFLLWLTFLGALIAVAPNLGQIFRFYGHAPLASGKPLLSMELLMNMAQAFPPGTSLLPGLHIALLVAVPLMLFFSGGVVWRAWTVDRFRFSDFLAESGRMFGRILRTLLWSLPLLALCAGVASGTAALLHWGHHDSIFTASRLLWALERPLTGWAVAHLLLTGVLLALWRMTLDTSRVLALVEEIRQTRKAVWRALWLVVRSPAAWMAYALLGLLEIVAVLVFMRLHAALPEGNTALALVALLFAQVVVLVRAGFQVSTTAFAANLVRQSRAAEPVGAPATASAASPAPEGPSQASPAEGEPFELLTSKQPPRTGSTSEMPLVDADLVDEEPPGGGSGKR